MASNKQSITQTFSRMKNGLAELQRWFPAFIKNDGVGGLSIDPVLYRTNFSRITPAESGGYDDEASQAGIRVEAINDDGTDVSNNPTITISGSGTLNAKCTINHDDGSGSTIIRLIAPSGDLTGVGSYTRSHEGIGDTSSTTTTTAPFPVFMTIQELTEMLDTYRHIGDGDENKKSWLPHGLEGGGQHGHSSASALPSLAGGDPREPTSVAFPTTSPYRATVFMPMMLDNNQFDKRITGASNDVADYTYLLASFGGGYQDLDIDRYDPDPEGDDSATIRYKTVGYSGDHLLGKNTAQQAWKTKSSGTAHHDITHMNNDISFDGSASQFPKYRTRCALAMFLKDGTYTLKGGTLIPYIYDPDREIGGKTTSTVHAIWDGLDGEGDFDMTASGIEKQCSAQITPMFDFLQPPLTTSAQGGNFDFEVVNGSAKFNWADYITDVASVQASDSNLFTDGAGTNLDSIMTARPFLVRNNPASVPVRYVRRNNMILSIWLDFTNVSGIGSSTVPQFTVGSPIELWGLTGALGSEYDNGRVAGQKFGADEFAPYTEFTNPDTFATGNLNHNGWWVINGYDDNGGGFDGEFVVDDILGNGDMTEFYGARIDIQIQTNETASTGNVSAYAPTSGYVCQGLIGGAEKRRNFYGIVHWNKTGRYIAGFGMGEPELRLYGIKGAIDGTGAGYLGGASTPANNVQSHVGHRYFYPSRLVDSYVDEGDWDDDDELNFYITNDATAFRSLELQMANDLLYSNGVPVVQKGNGLLRIPAPQNRDYGASRLYSMTQTHITGTYVSTDTTDFITAGGDLWSSLPATWLSRGLHLPLWSYIDTANGRHAWDYIKPVGASGTWLYGRNRPFPALERTGTRLGYNGGVALDTTKYGLSEMGCSAMWLDWEMKAKIPFRTNQMVRITFDTNEEHYLYGRHAMLYEDFLGKARKGAGFYPLYDGVSTAPLMQGTVSPEQFTSAGLGAQAYGGGLIHAYEIPYFTAPRTVIWFGDATLLKDTVWFGEKEYPLENAGGNCGWGSMNNGYGTGTSFTYAEGYHTVRAVFNQAGMNLLFDGVSQGIDTESAKTVWGLTIENCNLALVNHNQSIAVSEDRFPHDQDGNRLVADNQSFTKTQSDLQIDEMILRSIPTSAMLPFKVHTMKQNFSNVARYTSLTVEADNIDTKKGMNVKATLMTPSTTTVENEGQAVISGFENVDLSFSGGIGSMDLTGLPASAIADGFVIRFDFFIPNNTQTEYHPIDWSKLPIIRSWTVEYDEKPTASLAVIGNTYNGDITGTINTRVGHIISLRGTGTTTDVDRTISEVKFDFGDGASTGWIKFADQTTQSTTYDIAHSYLASGTYTVKCYSRDDSDNESLESNNITIVVANAPPVAILRAVPSMVRAGQAITFDGSASYDINAGGTLTTYTFTFGDGSSSVSGSSSSVSHTYADGGEYQATLVVVDSDGATSQTASVVVKVLPATLVVPLVLNTKPRAFSRTRSATLTQTPVLDSIYPELTDMGQRTDEFTLEGSFLKHSANADIEFMEELHLSGALVEIVWEEVNFTGTPTGKTFVGRMISFDYQREGGRHGETPYTAVFVREAGLGV